jgi:hypothetical protein
MVQMQTDYALIQLDKTNYKLIVAAFETRTGKKVETVADSKSIAPEQLFPIRPSFPDYLHYRKPAAQLRSFWR